MRMKGNSLQNCERQDHFGIRKLTIGAASVLLGTTLWLTNANEIVHADENDNSSDSEPQEADKSNISAPVINSNTKVQVQPQNNQRQSVVESNEQNKEMQAGSSVNEKAASLATAHEKQSSVNQANQNIASSKDDKTAENEQNKQTATGQNSTTAEQNSSAEKASSVWHQQAQTVQQQINQGTDKAIQNAQSNSLQLQENNENNEPDWQKIDLTKGGQISESANLKVAKTDAVASSDLQNDKSSNQVINHHDYQNFVDKINENGSLINSAKKGANSGSSLNKVKQRVVKQENQQEESKTDPLNLLTATFYANKEKALSLSDKALTNKLLFEDSKVSDDTSDNPTGRVVPENPGKPIEPVDPTIPEGPTTPQQPTEPDNPAQPTSAPSQPTNAPSDQKVTDTIVFTDVTTGTNLKQYSIEGMPGEKVNDHLGDLPTVADTIKTYTDQGYTVVSNNYQGTFGDMDQTYNVHLAHKVVDIDKNNPHGQQVTATVTRQVNYTVDGVPDSMLPSHTEIANFSATGHYDLFEHKVVDMVNGQEQVTNGKVDDGHLIWTVDGGTQDSSTLIGYAVPTKDGYHVNDVTVDPATDKDANANDTGLVKDLSVNHTSHNVTVTINLTNNGTTIRNQQTVTASQKVEYQDDQGNTLSPEKDQNFTFNYTGDTYNSVTNGLISGGHWIVASHNFTGENVPVINGYVAVSGYTKNGDSYTAGGFDTIPTASEAERNRTFIVVYKKTSNIVAVDPNHNPIPNAPTPEYPNDPKNPTGVVPNEPVPNVPGYTPTQPTVTSTDPTKPTEVVYTRNQVAQVVYRDVNDPQNIITLDTDGNLTGKSGDAVKDDQVPTKIQDFENEGYVLVDNGFTGAIFNNVEGNTQTFYITFKHGLSPVNPGHPHNGVDPSQYEEDVKETVHYEGAGDKTPADNVQTSKWSRTLTFDNVTGQLVTNGQYDTDWSIEPGQKTVYDQVDTPVIDGYYADQENVPATQVTQDKPTVEVTVHYVKNGTTLQNQQTRNTSAIVHYVIDGDDTNKPAAPTDNVQNDFQFNYSGDIYDSVTKKLISKGQWTTGTTHAYNAVTSPIISGYHTVTTIVPSSSLTVTTDNPTVEVTVHYVKNTTDNDTIYVDYHDEQGQTVGNRQVITGPIGQTISVATGVPDGWQVKPNTPFNYDFEKDYTLVTVTVDPVQAVISPDEVTPDKPFKGTDLHNENNADVIPGTKNKRITDDITYDDLHKEVQRSVIIVDPNGAVDKNAIIQTVNFKRNATINAVTGKITFGQWKVDGKDNFKAISVPTFKGYTASQTSVAAVNNVDSGFEDPHLLIAYKANDNQQNIKYENADGQVIASQVIKGKTDQNVAVKADIPDGWQLATNEKVPSEVKIAGGDTVVKIVPVESHIDPDTVTQTNPLTTNDVLPGTTSKHPKQAITYQDLHKDVNRTITIKNPDGTINKAVQTVHFSRPATINAATGDITFGQWTTEDSSNLPSVQVPEIPGYTASQSSVAAVDNVTADYSDPKLEIVYTPDEGQQTINYTDDQGHLIATQVVKGKTDQKISLSPKQIDGYHVVKSPAVPNEVTIKAKDQAVNVIVVPNKSEIKASDVTPTKDIKSTDVLPGTVNKHAKQDITYNDLHKTVSRQITVTLPSGQKQMLSQVVHFQRNASVNDGTGEVTYGQWQKDGDNSLAAVNLPQVSGYLPTANVPAINNVNHDDQDQQLNISYVKDTPANRLKIAAANLAASQSAQEANNKRLAEAKKNQEAAHQAYETNQRDLQKQSALVNQLNAQALSAKTFLTSLMADNSSSVAAKKARENLAALMAEVVAANQRIEQDQQAISEQKDKATKAQSTIDGLMTRKKTIDDRIDQLEKDMPEAAQVLDELKKQKGYQINLNQDYINAVSQYVAKAKQDYDENKNIKDINDDAALNDNFHGALARSGQGILKKMADNFKEPGAINFQEENNKIDLSKILPAEENRTSNETWDKLNQETTLFAFNLLNEVRDQLGLPELTLNEKTMALAKEIAQNYVRDGRSHYNTHGHDAKAVNDAASANDLDSVSNYEGDDPYNSHKQYYESLDGGSAQNMVKIVVPEDNGSYGITFVEGPKSQDSYETNLDSIKQVIFTNLLEMLINDGTTWGHTIQLLNIGPYRDYSQNNPVYRFGASMHLLKGEFNADNLAKYTNHYIVVPPNFIKEGKAGEYEATDRKNVPKDTFNPAALTKQQQKYLDEVNELNNLKEEKASIEQQISQQSLAQEGANDLVNKLQNDLNQAQSEKDGLNSQQTDAQNKSKEAAEKLAEHEQAVKDAQSKLDAAQKAAQEAEAKKEEFERKADAGKIKADESDQEVKNQTSQSEQKQQETKDAALVYQAAQNAGTSSSSDNNSSNDDSSKEDNGSRTNSSAKTDESDSSTADDANEDEPDDSDDNDDDSGDEADDDSASSVSNNGVQGESPVATHHGNVYSGLVHFAKSQNSQTASDTANSFYEQSSILPQTGESENDSAVAALAGAAAVSISLIGLAGVRKRKRI